MKKGRILSGLTAFVTAASATAVYAGAELNGKTDISDIISYMQSVYDGELKSYNFDVNCDNKVSILDVIYSKSEALGETEINSEKITVEYLNSVAESLSNDAETLAQELETEGVILSRKSYSYKDAENIESVKQEERRLVEQLDFAAKYYGVKKWKVEILNDIFDTACITGDAVLQRTGAFPAAVPRNLNIPYSDNLTEKAVEYYYDWKKDFGDYLSSDPSQGELSDYSPGFLISMRNRTAKNIFTELQTIAMESETMGKTIKNGTVTSDDSSDIVKALLKQYPQYSRVKWAADIKDYTVTGIVVSDPKSEFCSAYPHTIPETLNISYDEKLIGYASDFSKNWADDFYDCFTKDAEQLKYAEIAGKLSTGELNSYAKTVFTNAQTLMQEYETMGIAVENLGITQESSEHRLADDLTEMLPAEMRNKGLKWEIISNGYVILGTIVYDADGTGAYPNAVPANMRIPGGRMVPEYSAGSPDIWTEKYSDCVLETVEGSISPTLSRWLKKAKINSCNANAKTLFTGAQTVLQEMETMGEPSPAGKVITSDDNTEIVKKIKELLTGDENQKWAVYTEDFVVKGVIYSSDTAAAAGYQTYDPEKERFVYSAFPDADTVYTGSFPDYVPSDKTVNYDHSLVNRYSENPDTWNWDDVPGEVTPGQNDREPEVLSQTSKALINSYNASAKTLFTSASYVALEHEMFGLPIPDGMITSADDSEIAAEINASVIGANTRKWAAYAKNGEIIGIIFTENGNLTGSYPSPVTSALKYDHSLVKKYAEGNINW